MNTAIRGDLLLLACEGRFDVIVHGCNCMCVMSAGIAKQIRAQFPEAYAADLKTPKGSPEKLGTISTAQVQRGDHAFTVVNAYTQFDWRGTGVKADYEAIRSAMKQVKRSFAGARIGYPQLGAGLAGGDWSVISEIIAQELAGEDHALVIYEAHTMRRPRRLRQAFKRPGAWYNRANQDRPSNPNRSSRSPGEARIMSMKGRFTAAAILAGLTAALVGASGLLSVPIPAGAALQLAVPAGWQETHEAVGPTVTVHITVPGEKLLVILTVLPVKEGTPVSTPDGLKKAVTEPGTKALEGATQDHLELTALANPAGAGYAYHVTDRNPERGPRDYREANQGALLIGSHMITFTILTHTGDNQSVSLAMQMLRSLKISASASQADPSIEPVRQA